MAREFPGALRELDGCSAELLARKAAAVERALAGGEVPRWVEVVLDFHRALREALAVKLWLARRVPRGGAVTPELVAEWAAAHGGAGDAAFLEHHLHPPGGRVLELVFQALAPRHGLDADQIRAVVFGPIE